MLNFLRALRSAWLFALVAAALCLIFAYLAREQSPSYQECKASQAAKQPEERPSTIPDFLGLKCTLDTIAKNDAVITAVATVLLSFITGGLVWVGYIQLITARAQLRAYVLPDQCFLGDGTGLNPPQPARVNEPGIVLVIKNYGQTPAYEVISWAEIQVINTADENRLRIPILQNLHAVTLGSGSQITKPLWFGRPLTPYEIADIQTGMRSIFVHGRAEYRDVFRRKRYSNFRLRYTMMVFPPIGGSGTMGMSEQGNESS